MAEWHGWAIGFLTGAFTPLAAEYVSGLTKRPRVFAAVLGAQHLQENGQGWRVRISIRNDGGSGDTLVAAHMLLDRKDRADSSTFAMHEHENGLDVWAFRDPIVIPPAAAVTANLRFWTGWANPPDVIELMFLSGKRATIDVGNTRGVGALFAASQTEKALLMQASGQGDVRPHWFPAA